MDKTNEDMEIDLLDIFYLIKRRLWIIILTGIITASASGLISSFLITPMYTSRAQLYILSMSTSLTSFADIQIGTQLTQDYMVLVKSRPVVEQVIENLELDMDYNELVDLITVSNPSNTRILELKVTYSDEYLSQKIVNQFTDVSRRRIAEIMDADEPTVIEYGVVASIPSSPNINRNIVIGALLGICLVTGIIIVLHLMDDTIKNSEDVEKYLGISTIGLIPIEAGASKQATADKKRRKRAKSGKGKR